MNIDFIKWMIGYAEGFEIVMRGGIEGFAYIDKFAFPFDRDISKNIQWVSTYKPLLLQRAIEGINKKYRMIDSGLWISQNNRTVEVAQDGTERWEKVYWYEDCDNPDQVKEQALKYICEQEQT